MVISALLIALWLVPPVIHRIARDVEPDHIWRWTGLAFGFVVSPASLGLYSLYWWAGSFGVLGLPLAMVGIAGLVLASLHGWPGLNVAVLLGLVERGTVVHGPQHLYLALIDGVVWASVYGALGWIVDRWRTAGVPPSGVFIS